MSVKAMTWAFEQHLKPYPKLVLLALADHSDHEGVCWPGMVGIAEKTSMTKRAVIEIIQQLASSGYLTIEHQYRADGGSKANRYKLNMTPRVNHVHPPSEPCSPPPVNRVHPLIKEANHHEESPKESSSSSPTPPRQPTRQQQPAQAEKRGGGGPSFFNQFWESYPQPRERKQECAILWAAKGLEAIGAAIIADIATRKAHDHRWQTGYAPRPLTYLQGSRWEDDMPAGATIKGNTPFVDDIPF